MLPPLALPPQGQPLTFVFAFCHTPGTFSQIAVERIGDLSRSHLFLPLVPLSRAPHSLGGWTQHCTLQVTHRAGVLFKRGEV